ncbi:MAG: hypothetical protein ACO1O6_07280 [Bacteroidota bacterium]
MKSKLLLFFLLALSLGGFAQDDSVQTIVISKTGAKLYRGTDSEVQNWYFYIDEAGYSYLANLDIPEEEISNWFENRKNSDNIFKSDRYTEDGMPIFLKKTNEPDVVLSFQVFIEENSLLILNQEDQMQYNFVKINIQK